MDLSDAPQRFFLAMKQTNLPSVPKDALDDFIQGLLGCGLRLSKPKLLAGVSGGADSLALLLLSVHAAKRLGFGLVAVHVHHGLRGKQADADAAWVKKTCQAWAVPLKIVKLGLSKGTGMEARARKGRFAVFARLQRQTRSQAVLLAHHAQDQAETVLLHLCRGAGLDGAAGLKASQALQEPCLTLWRPMLGLSKESILALLTQARVKWRVDASNTDLAMARNRVRQQLLPFLESAHPGAVRHLASFAQKALEAHGFIEEQAQLVLEASSAGNAQWKAPVLRKASGLVARTALRMACQQLKGLESGLDQASTERLMALLSKPSGRCDLLSGWEARLFKGLLTFQRLAVIKPKPSKAGLR
jgi:tRNA(Ile)-lysidine synthase